jgi:CheY-like chemotaxis protein
MYWKNKDIQPFRGCSHPEGAVEFSGNNGVISPMVRRFTVLFVEDDTAVREMVVGLLREHGFNVLTASDGYEAIRLLVEHAVDLMFTDIVMPGLDGFELAQQAKLMRPEIHVLYMTGYAEQFAGRGLRYGKLLQKPVRPDTLLAEVCQALAP